MSTRPPRQHGRPRLAGGPIENLDVPKDRPGRKTKPPCEPLFAQGLPDRNCGGNTHQKARTSAVRPT